MVAPGSGGYGGPGSSPRVENPGLRLRSPFRAKNGGRQRCGTFGGFVEWAEGIPGMVFALVTDVGDDVLKRAFTQGEHAVPILPGEALDASTFKIV